MEEVQYREVFLKKLAIIMFLTLFGIFRIWEILLVYEFNSY